MKLLVVGATGRTGRLVVSSALDRGHEVTAFARNPAALATRDRNLRVARGDVLDRDSLGAAATGQDAVISTLAQPRLLMRSTLVSRGTQNIVEAMAEHGVRRFVCVGVLGVGTSTKHAGILYRLVVQPILLHYVIQDKRRQAQIIEGTELDWTIVHPPQLTDEPARKQYRVLVDEPGVVSKITRADLADFLVEVAEGDHYSREQPVIGY